MPCGRGGPVPDGSLRATVRAMRDTVTVWGEIQGREITFPMEVADFDAATLMFSVPADAAQALIPGDAFEVVAADGVAQLVVALCDYHRNPWGDYLEINLGFLARPAGAAADVVGSFVYRAPSSRPFRTRRPRTRTPGRRASRCWR